MKKKQNCRFIFFLIKIEKKNISSWTTYTRKEGYLDIQTIIQMSRFMEMSQWKF